VDDLVRRVLASDTRAAARLCRLVDDRAPGYRSLLRALHGASAPATVLGVTGSPGAGKSTLVDRLVAAFRARGGKVGVVAVDPTSPFTGGAILGDRIRMQRHFDDPDVFIRSVATRGALGGLSRSARDVARVLEAWGARVVVIETVGVGQDELDVTLAADTTIVVVAPGQGDDVQAIKAGILEAADVFAVNKADRPGADAAVRDLENMLALGALTLAALAPAGHGHSAAPARVASGAAGTGWTPPIVRTIATTDHGVAELVLRAEEHRAWLETKAGRSHRAVRARRLVESALRDALSERIVSELGEEMDRAAEQVLAREEDLDAAVERLTQRLRGGGALAP
jgi:LAO/AO transport system kinase